MANCSPPCSMLSHTMDFRSVRYTWPKRSTMPTLPRLSPHCKRERNEKINHSNLCRNNFGAKNDLAFCFFMCRCCWLCVLIRWTWHACAVLWGCARLIFVTNFFDQFLCSYGAGSMNSTFCLGIFFALIYFRGLSWNYRWWGILASCGSEWIKKEVENLMKRGKTLVPPFKLLFF